VQMAPKVGLLVNDGHAMIDAALNGLGLAQIYDRVVQPFVAERSLIHVLPEADDPRDVPVHALIPVGRRMPPKTRAVLEHLAGAARRKIASVGNDNCLFRSDREMPEPNFIALAAELI